MADAVKNLLELVEQVAALIHVRDVNGDGLGGGRNIACRAPHRVRVARSSPEDFIERISSQQSNNFLLSVRYWRSEKKVRKGKAWFN
jgi:hypothetical protein